MNKDWLQDYTAREKDSAKKFEEQMIDRKKPAEYPGIDRFPKLQDPVTHLIENEIWSQIPFSGSSIMYLQPISEGDFLKYFRLKSKRDIDDLIDMSRQTGRIQFALSDFPNSYLNCNYLEPLLSELTPPTLRMIPSECFSSRKEAKKFATEFDQMSKFGFRKVIMDYDTKMGGLGRDVGLRHFGYFLQYYIQLKALGHTKLCDTILNLMIDDPPAAVFILEYLAIMIIHPSRDPLRLFYNAGWNYTHERMSLQQKYYSKYIGETLPSSANVFLPYEIGRFLVSKKILRASNYSQCMDVINHYEKEELISLLRAIQTGCNRNDADLLLAKSNELSIVLDNIWKDAASIDTWSNAFRGELTAGIGIIGGLASHLGGEGILASVVVSAGISTISSIFTPAISTKLARILSPNNLVTIYDFQQDHKKHH